MRTGRLERLSGSPVGRRDRTGPMGSRGKWGGIFLGRNGTQTVGRFWKKEERGKRERR